MNRAVRTRRAKPRYAQLRPASCSLMAEGRASTHRTLKLAGQPLRPGTADVLPAEQTPAQREVGQRPQRRLAVGETVILLAPLLHPC